MSGTWVGVFAAVVGLLFAFFGSAMMRALIAVWGTFFGFSLGAALAASLFRGPILAGVLDWVIAIVVALVVGSLAYSFYAAAVVITMGSIGFGLATGLATALGIGNDVVRIVVGVLGAAVLIALGLLTNMPNLLLIVLTAASGAGLAVTGLMLLTGALQLDSAAGDAVAGTVATQWWWSVGYVVLGVAGAIVQHRRYRTRRLTDARAHWGQPKVAAQG